MATGAPQRRKVAIRDASIRLGQLLKLADLVEDGGEAKAVLLRELVRVNGEVETRRGRQLVPGDSVSVGDQTVVVARSLASDGEDTRFES